MYTFIEHSPELKNMIEGSHYLCAKNGVNQNIFALPEVTEDEIKHCKGLVTGHIHLMRRSSPGYYEEIKNVLCEHESVLLYMDLNFDVFGRYGDKRLKDELSAINLKLGTNLSEERVGTNAAVMASRCQQGVWIVGDEHYSQVLRAYACYAFRIDGKYNRNGYIMLITRVENLDKRVYSLFRFIENTECIVTAGLAAEDMLMRDTLQNHEFSKQSTNDILLMVDRECIITYANEVYYDFFSQDPMYTISQDFSVRHPELSLLAPYVRTGQKILAKNVTICPLNGKGEAFLADCTPIINSNEKKLGSLITLYRPKSSAFAERKSNTARYTFSDILGDSDVMRGLKDFAAQIARTRSPILIHGESGTGKELFANSIHNASEFRDGPFIAINCAAIPKDLIESELFGYVGGAFTGANKTGNIGKFELANGGTLFLDEIGEMPLEMQSVLLRVLEDRRVTRIGGTKSVDVNVRIITATNKDLLRAVESGSFREDLFYRLNVINLKMIPLRERKEDIPLIANSFIKRFSEENHVVVQGFSPEAKEALMDYDWPGNIRELRNVVERCVVICRGSHIVPEDLPEKIRMGQQEKLNIFSSAHMTPTAGAGVTGAGEDNKTSFSELFFLRRKETAEKLLIECKGNKSMAAKKMGVSRSTFYRILTE